MTATVVTTSAALSKKEKRMRRGRDPSRTPSRPRRPVFDNPRGQLPGTGIRSDGENLYGGNL